MTATGKAIDGNRHASRAQQARSGFAITAGLLGALIAVAIYAAIPLNVVKDSKAHEALGVVRATFPQGWAFFTKDPQDVELAVYAQSSDGSLTSLQTTPQTLPSNLFGLKRTQRAQGPEIAGLVDGLEWSPCDSGVTANTCIATAGELIAHQIRSPFDHPTLCGDLLIAQEIPTSWHFRNLVERERTAVSVVSLEVSCS